METKNKTPSLAKLTTELAKCYLLATQKGGVGKTGLTQQSALYCAQDLNQKTLLIDIEPQRNCTKYFLGQTDASTLGSSQLFEEKHALQPVLSESGVYVIQADKYLNGIPKDLDKIKNFILNVRKLQQEYDAIFVDVPPSGEPLLTAAHAAATDVIGLATCNDQSLDGLLEFMSTIETFRQVNPNVRNRGFVINLYFPRRKDEAEVYQRIINEPSVAKALICPAIQNFSFIGSRIKNVKPAWKQGRDKSEKKAAIQILAFMKKIYGVAANDDI